MTISLTPLKKINHAKGDIYHALKKSDNNFRNFGEAYFSWIRQNQVKCWKYHLEMTLNLIVPVGSVKFVVFGQDPTKELSDPCEFVIGEENYQRLTLPPKVYFGFKGLDKSNLVLNIASLEHDDGESVNFPEDFFEYDWSKRK